MFAWGDGKVLRLYRSDAGDAEVEHQLRCLTTAAGCGIRVPRVVGREDVDGRRGVVMERLDGQDLFGVIAKQPWRVWSIARLCGRLHANINSTRAPADLRTTRDLLRTRITQSQAVPRPYADAALKQLENLPDGEGLCHGDFHPGNVMLHQGEPVIIDWTNLSRGSPEADFARTDMMIRLGEVPPGMQFVIRILAKVARSVLVNSYAAAYHREQPVDPALLGAWRLPVAVARISEGIEAEMPALHSYIDRLLRDT